jgi:hypothetical protein
VACSLLCGCTDGKGGASTLLIDDMRNQGTDGPGTSGNWYTYSDMAVGYSEPPIPVSAAGTVAPPQGTALAPTNDSGGPTYLGSVQPYRRISGGGEIQWGAGFGMDFIDVHLNGGDVSMNDCDAGTIVDTRPNAASFRVEPFDANGWTGIEFWAKSFNAAEQAVEVQIQDDRTSPWGLSTAAGGCNVCDNITGTGGNNGCSDGPAVVVSFLSDWTHIQIPFASMHPLGWSGAPKARTLDLSAIYSFQFEVGANAGSPLPLADFDVGVAYVELYK